MIQIILKVGNMSTLKYPITISNGTLVLTQDYEKLIPEVITHTLLTLREERVMQPDFGIPEVTFNLLTDLPGFLRELESSLAFTLKEYPGVSVRLVGFADDSGEIPVTCYWSLDELQGEVEVTL